MLRHYLLAGPGLYRGPQPGAPQLQKFKELGLRTVVNLREESDESRFYCEHLALDYRPIPVADWTVPTPDQVGEFLEVMDQEASRPVLVHCWAGVGRTGLFVSAWRIRMGMGVEEALRLSDQETPHLGMSDLQRDWLRRFRPRGG